MAKTKSQPSANKYPQQLRIIGGEWRGRRFDVIDSEGLRPTPDRVRETVFNWLQAWVPGARCLDLFAGTGALCLEALSRGAKGVVMVEKSPAVARNLKQNIEQLGTDAAIVVNDDSQHYLQGPAEVFDIVFVDPPFKFSSLIEVSMATLNERGWIKPGSWVYIESPAELGAPILPPGWALARSKTAGLVGYHLARVNHHNDRETES
ncbi:MAG: 16S rRNA (guanine(966)-N(2))-methyltransferase RsmD [Acidiferrobacterales bacterium]